MCLWAIDGGGGASVPPPVLKCCDTRFKGTGLVTATLTPKKAFANVFNSWGGEGEQGGAKGEKGTR